MTTPRHDAQDPADGPLDRSARRRIAAWCLYDWANSPYTTVIGTFVFGTYVTQAVLGSDPVALGTWSLIVTLSGVLTALTAPVVTAVADRGGNLMRWLIGLTLVFAAAAGGSWFVTPERAALPIAAFVFIVGSLAFESAVTIYSATLGTVVPRRLWGRISGIGWGVGYFGGIVALLLALVIIRNGESLGLDASRQEPVRLACAVVGLWTVIFAVPSLGGLLGIKKTGPTVGLWRSIVDGVGALRSTVLRLIREDRNTLRFLGSRMLYLEGLNTLFALGGVYAGRQIGMDTSEVILFGVALNVTAGIGAVAFGFVDERIGARPTIIIALLGLVGFGIPLLVTTNPTVFWVVGILMATFMGPAQAASRTLLTKLAPSDMRAEVFGIATLTGKASTWIGPLGVAIVANATNSEPLGMGVIVVLLVIGLALLWSVREPK